MPNNTEEFEAIKNTLNEADGLLRDICYGFKTNLNDYIDKVRVACREAIRILDRITKEKADDDHA